jgi:hypothetical protein
MSMQAQTRAEAPGNTAISLLARRSKGRAARRSCRITRPPAKNGAASLIRRWQYRGDQAVGGDLGVCHRTRAPGSGGGAATRHGKRGDGTARGRGGARGASQGPQDKLYRQRCRWARAIAAAAGKRLVSCVLELGGKSPNIVFADADLDRAEAGVLAGIFAAAGQTCVAGSRAYIQRPVYDEMVERLINRARAIRIGDPMLAETQMEPVATAAQLRKDESMVQRAVSEGAEILYGGERLSLPKFPNGYFFSATILHRLNAGNSLLHEEVFGPVLAVVPFDSEDEVLELANSTDYGLAAGVWTNDLRRAHLMARRLQAGTVWLNTYRALTFNSPFGGYKDSGVGRQNGIEAILQYAQTKSVWCELSEEVQDPFVIRTGGSR